MNNVRSLLRQLRPSGSKRWLNCQASPGVIARLGLGNESSTYADEGTEAHALAALAFNSTWEHAAKSCDNKEMLAYVKGYYDHVKSHANKPDDVHLVEQPVRLFYAPKLPPLEPGEVDNKEDHGTADSIVVRGGGAKVFIDDLKYGAGISVQAKKNTQLAIYAYSAMLMLEDLYEFTDKTLVTLCIYQPRIASEEPRRLWVLSYKDLRDFCLNIQATAESILADPDTKTFAPAEDTCQFCPMASQCIARAAFLLGELPVEDEAPSAKDAVLTALPDEEPHLELVDPALLTHEQLSKVLSVKKHLVKYLNECEAFVHELLTKGGSFPGYKLVAGRSNRQWVNEEDADKFLRGMFKPGDMYTQKLISPTQAEAMMKTKPRRKTSWERFEQLVTKPTGGPTLAPEDDKRPALQMKVDVNEEFAPPTVGEELL